VRPSLAQVFYLYSKSLKFSNSNGSFRFSGTVTNGNEVTSRLFGTVSIPSTSYASFKLALKNTLTV
jgi:hypothetical protein